MYCKLQELQGIEYMPASFLIPLVTLLRRYFFKVLQDLYTNLAFSGTKRLLFPFLTFGWYHKGIFVLYIFFKNWLITRLSGPEMSSFYKIFNASQVDKSCIDKIYFLVHILQVTDFVGSLKNVIYSSLFDIIGMARKSMYIQVGVSRFPI